MDHEEFSLSTLVSSGNSNDLKNAKSQSQPFLHRDHALALKGKEPCNIENCGA